MRTIGNTLFAAALSVALSGSPALAASRAPAESLDKLLLGTWDIRAATDLDAPCSSTYYSRFLPGGIYEDGDTRGRYSVTGQSLTFIPGGDGGKRSTSTLVRKVSRDKLIWSNEDGRFGMRRC